VIRRQIITRQKLIYGAWLSLDTVEAVSSCDVEKRFTLNDIKVKANLIITLCKNTGRQDIFPHILDSGFQEIWGRHVKLPHILDTNF
jgi:hypothetical protein